LFLSYLPNSFSIFSINFLGAFTQTFVGTLIVGFPSNLSVPVIAISIARITTSASLISSAVNP